MRLSILLVCLVSLSEPRLSVMELEDSEAAVWDVPGNDFDWSAPMFAANVSLPPAASDFLPVNASSVLDSTADGLVSMDFDDALSLMDLGFQQQVKKRKVLV